MAPPDSDSKSSSPRSSMTSSPFGCGCCCLAAGGGAAAGGVGLLGRPLPAGRVRATAGGEGAGAGTWAGVSRAAGGGMPIGRRLPPTTSLLHSGSGSSSAL